MVKRKQTKQQATIYKTLHRKLNIEHHKPHQKPGVNSGTLEGWNDVVIQVNDLRKTYIPTRLMDKWIVLKQCKTFSYRFIVFFNVIFLVIKLSLLFFIFCLLLILDIIRSLWRNFLIIFFCFLFFFFRWFFWFLYFIFCFNLQKYIHLRIECNLL